MKNIFYLITIFLCAASVFAFEPMDDTKEIYQRVKDTFVNAVTAIPVEGGVRYEMEFDGNVIIYDNDMNEVYTSGDMRESIDLQNFLDGVSTFVIDEVAMKDNTAEVFLDIYEGTVIAYKSKMSLNKYNNKWEVVSKVFYELNKKL